ncbi:MAG TPA: efflux RND transporter periplasmic adaptor subunit [Polyangiaceae bacterium]|jgi:multidrug efflux system membrane fusion protein
MSIPPRESNHSALSKRAELSLDRPPRAPLAGIVFGCVLALGLVGWTGVRIRAAKSVQAELGNRRTDDARRAAQEAAAPQPVHVVRGISETWQPVVEFEGSLAAAQAAELGFKVSGRIASVRAKLGDIVKTGALLGTLDASEAAAQVRSADAQQRAAQAQLTLADDNASRTAQMVQSGAFSEASGVQSSQQKSLALAQLDAAKAAVGLAQVNLGNQTLTAPFQGTITRVPTGIGAVVSPGAVQFELLDLGTLKLKGSVGEADANLVHVGSSVAITGERGEVQGTVSAVLGAVDPATRRVPIEALIDNKNDKTSLRAGTFVRARVLGGAPIPVLRVPHETLRPGSQDELMVVQNGKLVSKHVAFSIAKDGSLFVRFGLDPSDDVLLLPKAEAQTGDRVAVQAGATP